ncbi:hypothetical protein [Micromonospora parva]|uniref:hypothetical protein n=1 Tax=Micromonospora parva TaxID=1464048 RepID=UPI0033E7434A
MSTLAALRRAEAFDTARAVPKASRRHVELDDAPLVITLNVLAGEPFAPLGITWGTDPREPAGHTVIPEPRNRDLRYAGLAEFGQALNEYLKPHLAYTIETSSRGVQYPECATCPQIVVPDAASAKALVLMAGRGVRYAQGAPPAAAWAAAHLTMIGQHRDFAGQSLLLAATNLLSLHWETGQADLENQNLAALLAWIDPDAAHTSRADRLDAIAIAEKHTWGPLRSPDFDRGLIDLIRSYHRSRSDRARDLAVQRITDEVLPELVAAYRGTHRALRLLRTRPPAPSAFARRVEDRKAWASHARRSDAAEPPRFTARDTAQSAQRAVAYLEGPADLVPAQMAYDDPLIMAEHVDVGQAFTGDVVAVDENNREVRPGGRNRVRVPIITVRTASRPPHPTGTTVWWADNPAIKCSIRSVRTAYSGLGDDLDDSPYLINLTVLSGMAKNPLPAAGDRHTFATLSPGSGAPAPRADEAPWTHQPRQEGPDA